MDTKQLLTESIDFIESNYQISFNPKEGKQFNILLSQENSARKDFVEKLSEGLEGRAKADYMQFAENCYLSQFETAGFLSENTASTVQQFAIIDSLMLREIWNRTGARDAMTYKVMESPAIQVPFLKQVLTDIDGNVVDVPHGLPKDTFRYKTLSFKASFTNGTAEFNVFDAKSGGFANGSWTGDQYITDKANLTLSNFGLIVEATPKNDNAVKTGDASAANLKVKVKAGQEGNIFYTYTWKDKNDALVSDTIIGQVDRVTGNVVLTTTKGLIESVNVEFKVSTEANRFTKNIKLHMERFTISVGDGDTINSQVPIQFLQDYKKLFNIDGVTEISNILSRAFNNEYDKEVYYTFADAVDESNPAEDQILSYNASINTNNAHNGISRQMQNADLLDRVLRSIGCIDNRYQFDCSVDYYVLANPIENSILVGAIAPDFAASNVVAGGVLKPYTSGQLLTRSGENDVRVVTSKNYTKGKLYLVPKPSVDSYICFGYFDYSQVLMPVSAYRAEGNSLVPNIMMNKRKVIKAFRPDAINLINVNNSTRDA